MNASGKTNIQVPLWLLLLIAFTGTLAMHIFVPALPLAQTTLDASSHQIQMTITVYVIGLAVGQLIYGPISDAIGRRPAVFAGLLIFLLGSIGAAFAQTLPSMVTARLIQGLGGAGGLSLARAMVKDGAGDKSATKKLALMNLILLIGPGIAPVIGSLISSQLGWRYIFYALSVLGGAGIVLSVLKLPETIQPSGHFMPKQMANDFMHVITNRRFALITAGGCLASTANYAYFASAPYILHDQLGVPLDLVGYYVGSTLIGAAVGTLSARYFVERIKIGTFVFWAGVCAVVNALAIVILAITGTISPLLVLILTFTQLLFAGAISPLALGTALSILPKMAGSASGVYGFLQMLTGAICTFLVGLGSNPAIACGSVLLACYALSFLLFHTVRSDARRASGHQ